MIGGGFEMVERIKINVDTLDLQNRVSDLKELLLDMPYARSEFKKSGIDEAFVTMERHRGVKNTYAISIVGEEGTIISVLNNDEVKRMEKNIEDKNSLIKIGESYFKDCMIISIIRMN